MIKIRTRVGVFVILLAFTFVGGVSYVQSEELPDNQGDADALVLRGNQGDADALVLRGNQGDAYALVLGDNQGDAYDDLQTRQDRKAEIEAKIVALKSQEQTLNNQIAYFDYLIEQTGLEQDQARYEIDKATELLYDTEKNIEIVSDKMGNLDGAIDELYTVLAARVRTSYQLEYAGGSLFFNSNSFQDIVLNTVYLESLQKEDKRLLSRMNDTREVYQLQKRELVDLKDEKEELKAQLEYQHQLLEQQKVDLANQQSTKAWVLQVTQSEETEYQKLLAQIEEEIRAIRAALVHAGTKIGDVKQGDVIGHLGNTGCSTGAHVHFGYYVNGVATDPAGKLNSGEFIWPVADPRVTQWYGENYSWYMANFGMPGHNGIDLVDGTVGYGAPVLAVADGVAYKVSDSAACWLTGTVGQGVRIDHADGTKTIYWHLQ